jgi:hypothetical protein
VSERPAPPQTRFGSWVPGIVLIALGLIFLAREYGGLTLENWWALFILIPAYFTLERAYAYYRVNDTRSATGPAIGGLALLALTAIFLLDLPIGQLWPIFLIIAGIGLLLSRRAWSSS